MNKTFRAYIGVWSVCITLFTIIAFIVPGNKNIQFYTGYIFICISFLGQFFCVHQAFKEKTSQKFFYKFPLISLSYWGTLLMLICGSVTMAIKCIPPYIGVIICLTILGFTIIAVISASAAGDAVIKTDDKIKSNTLFMKNLMSDALLLQAKAKSQNAKELTQKVCEAIRYSNSLSDDSLRLIEAQITLDFEEFKSSVINDSPNLTESGETLLVSIEERNIKCKFSK